MVHPIVPALLLLFLTIPWHDAAVLRASDADPADYLPSGVSIRQTAEGDVDGDGRVDAVTLYSTQPSASALPRASLLVLLTTDDGVHPIHLFGEPPDDLRGEPALDPNGTTNLILGDLNADGIGEIQLSLTVQYQEPSPRTTLWVFGRGDIPVRPEDQDGPPAPPWAGTGFRLQAYLEGNMVEIVAPGPLNPDRTSTLRRELVDRRLSGPDPALEVTETFQWRDGAFRLTERALSLPAGTGSTARSPETAVLAFYEAVSRGDLPAATDLLSDELRASRSSTMTGDPAAPTWEQRVEEVRVVNDVQSRRERSDADRLVYVRVSMFDPGGDPPPPASPGDWIDRVPPPPPPRTTIAGTWRTQKVGDRWRLAAGTLHETANLDAISGVLPPGTTVVETASGDLRGLGIEDLVILADSSGRFGTIEPYVIFGGAHGPERSVPLGSFVEGGFFGGVGGTVGADDVNADGKPEVTLSAFVGAHSALLWVLQWDGSTFVPLFAEVSNSPVVDLTDLDGDGVAEIVLGQSGYCGSYAASPQMQFAFRWEDGAYRSASMRYPSLHAGIDERATQLAASPDGQQDAQACVQHMLAMAQAFQGRAADARTAYRAYAQLRQQVADDTHLFVRPIYLAAEYVEADLRAVLAAAQSGQSPGWDAPAQAVLHDLLGDVLLERARSYQYRAESAVQHGNPDEASEARRKAAEARQAATREYQAALTLDAADEEARRILGE